MNLRKKWSRVLATYSGSRWAMLHGASRGDGLLRLYCQDADRLVCDLVVKTDGGAVDRLVRSLIARPDSVPAYAMADAIREEMEGDPDAVALADMIQRTLPT